MAVVEVIFSLLFIFSLYKLPHTAARTSTEACSSYFCSGKQIRFPFRLQQGHQLDICGYPGFELSCNNNRSQTILSLPNAGQFIANQISYTRQEMLITDPDHCLPKRLLNFSLLDSPFSASMVQNQSYTYFNCSEKDAVIPGYMSFSCLGGHNYSVLAGPTFLGLPASAVPPSCVEVAKVLLPVSDWMWTADIGYVVILKWDKPSCGSCEKKRGTCGFKRFPNLDVGCFNLPSGSGIPRTAKYGIIIGVGIPGLLCLIGFGCYICGRLRVYARPRNQNIEFGTSITPQPGVNIVKGLDGKTIDSYPKIVLGESKRLPKPNDDGTCSICLSEYQPKDTLRTIPECNHYFHAQCIDEWLGLNATCPLCRNTPDGSSHVTPSSHSPLSLSSSSSSSSS